MTKEFTDEERAMALMDILAALEGLSYRDAEKLLKEVATKLKDRAVIGTEED